MTEPTKRRWFSFSLRTMLIVVTVFCIWLGWQLNIVRERNNARQEMEASKKFDVTTADAYVATYAGTPPETVARISLVRRLLGDEAVQRFSYPGWGDGPSEEEIKHVRHVFPEATVDEIPAEPCHPGCFPRGTLVATPVGARRIEEIQPGDLVLSLTADGSSTKVAVQQVFVTENRLWRVETELGDLVTTETQPLCVDSGAVYPAGKLQPGDAVLFHGDGEMVAVLVKSVSRTGRTEQVFNLILGDSQMFVAGGYLARSKPPTGAVAALAGN